MGRQILGFDPLQIVGASGTPEFPLGTIAEDALGKRFIYCRANGATVADFPVAIDINYDITDGAGVLCDGILMVTLADNEFGWVQVSGVHANVNVKASEAAGAPLAYLADANGDMLDISATSAVDGSHNVRGKLLEAEAAGVGDVLLFNWL